MERGRILSTGADGGGKGRFGVMLLFAFIVARLLLAWIAKV